MLKRKPFLLFLDEDGGGAAPDPTPDTGTEEPADTGRDVEELKNVIGSLKAQLSELTDELKRKDPDQKSEPADYQAYFKELMK